MVRTQHRYRPVKILRVPPPSVDFEDAMQLVLGTATCDFWMIHNRGDYQIWHIPGKQVLKLFYLRTVILPFKESTPTRSRSFMPEAIDRIRSQQRLNRA